MVHVETRRHIYKHSLGSISDNKKSVGKILRLASFSNKAFAISELKKVEKNNQKIFATIHILLREGYLVQASEITARGGIKYIRSKKPLPFKI